MSLLDTKWNSGDLQISSAAAHVQEQRFFRRIKHTEGNSLSYADRKTFQRTKILRTGGGS
jgi:hypothetical protein